MVKMVDPTDLDDEKLVGSNPQERNWRGILIAVLVIIIVLALIVTSVVLLTPPDDGPRVKGRRFELHDILNHEFSPLRFNGSWVSSNCMIFKDVWGGISLLNASNLSIRTLMSNQTYRILNPAKFVLSPDHNYLLLAQNVKKLFRHSYLAQYTVYDIQNRQSYPLTVLPENKGHPYLLSAEWSPRPRGHGVIMVHDYDIYYREEPRSNTGYRITHTAVPGVVSNGVPDWLYEEEILSTNTAYWLSKDGHLLVYATFNDSLVEELKFPWFGNPEDGGNLYPDIRSLRYPRPGTPNPIVTLRVADLADPNNIGTKTVKPPDGMGPKQDLYFTAVTWVSLTEISVVWLNRPQNISMVTICKSPAWVCQETHKITGDGRGWVDVGEAPLFSPDGQTYVSIAPVRDGPAGHFRHIISVNIPKKRVLPLTHGRFEVTRILSWDHKNDLIYYLGIPEQKPGQQHLYRITSIPPRIGAPLKPPHCLTCEKGSHIGVFPGRSPPTANYYDMSGGEVSVVWGRRRTNTNERDWSGGGLPPLGGSDDDVTIPPTPAVMVRKKKKKVTPQPINLPCQFHNAIFSPVKVSYYVLECLGPGVPTSQLYATGMPQPKLLMHLQNNTYLKEKLSKMAQPQIKTFPVQISGGYHAQVRLHLPPGLREEEITKYPLVVQVYGGPGTQLVTDRWRIDWNTYLASKKDYIIAQIDGRGSGGQGYDFLHEVYYRLGTVEVADQLEVTEYLRDSLHFIDGRRVAVWGWSYGGFVASLALASSLNVFHCGIAIAPVTNWKLYDSAYTERYMGYPNVTANYKGYEEADVSQRAEQLRAHQLYLIHGSADDNVHIQQSMVLSRALASHSALFRQQIYPDESHNLGGVKRHLYMSMSHFLDDCFRKQVPPDIKAGLRNGGGYTN